MTCPICKTSTLTPSTHNGIVYRYCLPVRGGCGYGERADDEHPRDLFALMGVKV